MKYRAVISFTGKVSMMMGEVREISDQSIVKDLLNAKYIEPIETKPRKKKGGKDAD